MCVTLYSEFLQKSVMLQNWDILSEDIPDIFCASSSIQLFRDVHRRMRKNAKRKLTILHMYCRWGNDYRLTDQQVILPLGKGFKVDKLKIDCIYRPFQQKLLTSKHPETLVLKQMKSHWYAYLLVEGDI